MKKMKKQNGITLIALIITIVVLMILAVVTINSVKDGGIITHAQNSANKYNKAKDNEIDALASYEQLIDENNPNVKKVDYDAIAQILTDFIKEGTAEEDMVKSLKEELEIDDRNIEEMTDLLVTMVLNNNGYFYFYKIDALYGWDFNTNTFVYLEEKENEEQYAFGRNINHIKGELERIFIGKTYDEMLKKLEDNELDKYILEKSDKISNISTYQTSFDTTIIRIRTITITNDTGEFTLSTDEDNYSNWICFKDGVCYTVQISAGT